MRTSRQKIFGSRPGSEDRVARLQRRPCQSGGAELKVTSIVPATGAADLQDLIAGLTEPGFRREPFGDATIGFCGDFSRALFRDEAARRYPELQALAFWMRRSGTPASEGGFSRNR